MSASGYVDTVEPRALMTSEIRGKRLGNTPFRREACVVKWLDEKKTENVNTTTPHPCGSSGVSGRVCEERYATQRVLSEPGLELRHAESAPEGATLEEKEPSSFFGRPVGAGGVVRQEVADPARIELWASRGAAGRAPDRGASGF